MKISTLSNKSYLLSNQIRICFSVPLNQWNKHICDQLSTLYFLSVLKSEMSFKLEIQFQKFGYFFIWLCGLSLILCEEAYS